MSPDILGLGPFGHACLGFGQSEAKRAFGGADRDLTGIGQRQQNSQPMVAKWCGDSLTVIILLICRLSQAGWAVKNGTKPMKKLHYLKFM
ncbi:MAG: hypothetical protein O3A97_04900 [Proteobacteria bacterium]|nr:hypothetical protein [Pseudomonadota bacterium]